MESKRFLISQGRELQYYLFGHGSKTIVMLHAQGTSSESYFEAAEYLAKSSKVILIDYYTLTFISWTLSEMTSTT